jgi:hypothetical protein
LLKFEFMIFAFRFHQELADKTKTANPSGRRFSISRGEFLFQRSLAAHRRELSFPLKAPWPPLPGCQTSSRKSFLMFAEIVNHIPPPVQRDFAPWKRVRDFVLAHARGTVRQL